MTEKRFECDKGSRIIIDNETKLHYIMTLDWECRLITKLLNRFADENEKLKAQLYCDFDEGVCRICKHHYVEKGNIFYISKCEKGHEECSTDALKHCKDFELKELQE